MDRSWSRATQGIEEVTCTYDVDRILVVCYDHIEAEHMQHELACLDYTTRILSLNNETNKLLNAFRNRSINVLILTYITWNAIKNAPFTPSIHLYDHNVLWLSPELEDQAHRIFIEWLKKGWDMTGIRPRGVHKLIRS
jgi:hypothetical protein